MRGNCAVYFAAVGGIAALLAKHVTASETVAWDDLGTERCAASCSTTSLSSWPSTRLAATSIRAIENGEDI